MENNKIYILIRTKFDRYDINLATTFLVLATTDHDQAYQMLDELDKSRIENNDVLSSYSVLCLTNGKRECIAL